MDCMRLEYLLPILALPIDFKNAHAPNMSKVFCNSTKAAGVVCCPKKLTQLIPIQFKRNFIIFKHKKPGQ